MVGITDIIQELCLNTMIISAGVWTFLRAVEKVYDILLKNQRYKKEAE